MSRRARALSAAPRDGDERPRPQTATDLMSSMIWTRARGAGRRNTRERTSPRDREGGRGCDRRGGSLRTVAASGPWMRSRNFAVRMACSSAPLRLTPMTCPVVRNRYVTALWRALSGLRARRAEEKRRRTAGRNREVFSRYACNHSLQVRVRVSDTRPGRPRGTTRAS